MRIKPLTFEILSKFEPSSERLSELESKWFAIKKSQLSKAEKSVKQADKQSLEVEKELNQYLDTGNETLNDKYANLIFKNCKEFLNVIINADTLLYRGVSLGDQQGHPFVGNPRSDRKPKDTSVLLHNSINYHLKSLGFEAIRSNSIFCSGNLNMASNFGSPYIIFPLDGYKFTWSPVIRDFTQEIGGNENRIYPEETNEMRKQFLSFIKDVMLKYLKTFKEEPEELSQMSPDEIQFIEMYKDRHAISGSATEVMSFDSRSNLTRVMVALNTRHPENKIGIEWKKAYDGVKPTRENSPLITKFHYTNQNLPNAIRSGNEIMLIGSYYAFPVDSNQNFTGYFYNLIDKYRRKINGGNN